MLMVLTIDADYWFPLDQDGHCGRCPDQDRNLRRMSVCTLFGSQNERRQSTEDERTTPTIADIVEMVRPGTPVKVTESHAEMFFILYRLHVRTGERLYVVNIDEHSDAGWCGHPTTTTVTTRGMMKTRYVFPVLEGDRYSHIGKEPVHCGVWAEAAVIGGWLRANNYRWIGDERSFRRWRRSKRGRDFSPDLVHVCHSAPYMSTRGDPHFAALVRELERVSGHRASFYGHKADALWKMVRRRDVPHVSA